MKNKSNIIFIIVLILLSTTMFFWISNKEGFHEDEIFSYGSSNYKYDNTYQRFGDKDAVNIIVYDEILKGNVKEKFNNLFYYFKNPSEFTKRDKELKLLEKPVWKTKEDAKTYATIGKEDIFNYFSVYYNQGKDVHPPLFYFLVHLFSTLFFGIFSKYIIFIINLIFFILTCIYLKKILKIFNKEKLSIPVILLYGLSIGSISTIIFLRMYQMLIFFIIYSLYIHFKIVESDFNIDKKLRNKLILVTVLGFLTQYYYCFFAFFECLVLLIYLIKNKKIQELFKYLKYLLISALIGIVLFPTSIYHIFFSYRGIASKETVNILERIILYFQELSYAFSIPTIIFIIICLGILSIYIFNLIKKNKKTKSIYESLLIIPFILYFLIVAIKSPEMRSDTIMRYISILIPILSIIIVLYLDNLINKIANKKTSFAIIFISIMLLSTYGMVNNEPRYLYKGYNEILNVANKNGNNNFVYISDDSFTYLKSMPEFLTYNKSLIINKNIDSLEILIDNEELTKENEFVLSINKWLNYEDILNKVLEYTHYNNYVILEDNKEFQTIIYKVFK